MKVKLFHVAERYHFYGGVRHAQIKPYVCEKKNYLFYKEIDIKTERKMQKNEWTKFGLERF